MPSASSSPKVYAFNEAYRHLIKLCMASCKHDKDTETYETLKNRYKDYSYDSSEYIEFVIRNAPSLCSLGVIDVETDVVVDGFKTQKMLEINTILVKLDEIVRIIKLDDDASTDDVFEATTNFDVSGEDTSAPFSDPMGGFSDLMKNLDGTEIGRVAKGIADKVKDSGSENILPTAIEEISKMMQSGGFNTIAAEAMKMFASFGGGAGGSGGGMDLSALMNAANSKTGHKTKSARSIKRALAKKGEKTKKDDKSEKQPDMRGPPVSPPSGGDGDV